MVVNVLKLNFTLDIALEGGGGEFSIRRHFELVNNCYGRRSARSDTNSV
jgi:hypothetical protein